jgi:hypothetical protein
VFQLKGDEFQGGRRDRRNVALAPFIGPGRFALKISPLSRDSNVASNFSLMVLCTLEVC